ncbi:MAG TPA: hypothetical protein PKY96_02045 [Flavobacteriales bacterium]|nr:hypothetical protein [Flavobacteriales bacterium]
MLASLALHGAAQWDVPVRIELDGAEEPKRQVIGLAPPLAPDAAVSVDASRNSSTTFTSVAGSAVFTGTLVPPPAGYAPGMILSIVPSQTNEHGVLLDLNGLGPRPIINRSGLPVDSAALPVGKPARLMYDGQAFRVLSSLLVPCPAGYATAGREYCIESVPNPDTTFYGAVYVCRMKGARLCTMGEWVNACLANPAFIGTVLSHEWVDSAANNNDGAKRVGGPGDGISGGATGIDCLFGGWASYNAGSSRFRCCTNR